MNVCNIYNYLLVFMPKSLRNKFGKKMRKLLKKLLDVDKYRYTSQYQECPAGDEVGKYLIDSLAWNAVNRWRRNQTEERVLKIHSTSSTIIYSRGRLGLLTLPTFLQRTHTNFFGSSKSRMNDKKIYFHFVLLLRHQHTQASLTHFYGHQE